MITYCLTVLAWAVYMIGMNAAIYDKQIDHLEPTFLLCFCWILRAIFWPLIPVVRLLEAVPMRLLQAGEPT